MSLLLLFPNSGAAPPVVVVDTHDSWKDNKKRKKKWEEERERRALHRAGIEAAWDLLVEGKSPVIEEIAQEFPNIIPPRIEATKPPVPDFKALMDRQAAVEKMWAAYLEMDDEDVLVLI